MFTVKVYTATGDLIFAGQVPEEDVIFDGGLDRNRTCSFRLPVKDMMAYLESKCGHEVECETCGERGCPIEGCPNFDAHFRGWENLRVAPAVEVPCGDGITRYARGLRP